MAHLFVVEEADFVFLIHHTGLTWGNLSTHLTKLENGGYIDVQKSFAGKKPRTTLKLTKQGRHAFSSYRQRMQKMLDESDQ
ncbi:MAG: transcriptional regulator [Candidatus Marinimicrobia bacterium]|nr:transcriptional regulator [Candidatus Neomarinimicrobiota bacterium]